MTFATNGMPRGPHEHGPVTGLLPTQTITIRGVTTPIPCSCGIDSRLIAGEPQATYMFKAEELKAAGLVGYYWP